MGLQRRFRLLLAAVFAAVCLLGLAAPASAADAVTQPVRLAAFKPEVHAWARVESAAPLVLRMPLAARIQRLLVSPGQAVGAGAPLVLLGGPRLDGQLAVAKAEVAAARRLSAAAERSAASARRSFPSFINRRQLDAAQAGLDAARGRLARARAELRALSKQTTIASPVAATVSAIHAATGADLPAGAPLLDLVARSGLLLRAEVFGRAPPVGSRGRFVPDDGGDAVPVRLAAWLPERAADGARVADFSATGSGTDWQEGEAGEVVMSGPAQTAVAVPVAALILDAGRWLVLTDRGGRLAPVRVEPGPTRGGEALLLRGPAPGTPVVVRQAYLLFHRDLAAHYAPPD